MRSTVRYNVRRAAYRVHELRVIAWLAARGLCYYPANEGA